MSTIAFCSSCGRYVELTTAGTCPQGHRRSDLRDVREGVLDDPPPSAAGKKVVDDGGWLAQVIGKGIVLVPVGLILVWGLWTGYEQFSGMGMSPFMKMVFSAVSLATTIGLAFLFAGRKRR